MSALNEPLPRKMPARCKHCGEEWSNHMGVMQACKENAELKRETDTRAEPDANGTVAQRMLWWKQRTDELHNRNEELARNNAALNACVCPECDRSKERVRELEGLVEEHRETIKSFYDEMRVLPSDEPHVARLNGPAMRMMLKLERQVHELTEENKRLKDFIKDATTPTETW